MSVTTNDILEKRVGIRQFRDGLTRHLRQVRRGVRIAITDRGNPVALISPYENDDVQKESSRMRALLSGGHVAPADRTFFTRLPAVKGKGIPPSRIISEERR
jgi:antitoxin (DNA-binding transcriptional repressor) of toxin-antitoxin stability system